MCLGMRFIIKRRLMKAQDIRNADYLDILFDKRNKKYGSYALRKYHDRDMVRSLLLMMGLCVCFIASGFLPADKAVATVEKPPVVYEFTPVEIEKPPVPPDVPDPTPPEPPASRATVKNKVPVVAPDEIVTELPTPVDSFDGRESGPVTASGDPTGSAVATTNTNGTGREIAVVSDEPVDYTDEMPEFKGNVAAYLNRSLRYPRRAVQAGIQGRVIVQFVVNRDGSIGDVKLVRGIGGGCDEEAIRVVANMPAWKPGLQHGKPVRVNYKLPISFRLE